MKIASKLVAGMILLAACAKPSATAIPVVVSPVANAPSPVSVDLDPVRPPAGVTVTHSVKSYAVTGTDRRTIRAQLHVPDGTLESQKYAGRYDWKLSWRYQTTREGTLCRVTRATVTLTSTVTLPEWSPAAKADPALEGAWTRFRRALVVHEQGHRDLAYAGAARVRQALESTPPQPCLSIAVEIGRTAEPLMNAMRVEQERYDATTRHGATQGATF